MKRAWLVIAVLASSALLISQPPAIGQVTELERYIVVLEDNVKAQQVSQAHAKKYGLVIDFVYRYALQGYAARIDPNLIAAIESEAAVQWVQSDTDGSVPPGLESVAEAEVEQSSQVVATPVNRIEANVSSTVAGDGQGSVNINVAVLDTGISRNHPDLNVVNGVSCVTPNPGDWEDPVGHGTLVAGFLAARDNAIGFVGIAPGARLSAVRVLPAEGLGLTSHFICGIDWVAQTRLDNNRNNDIAVANMSLGGFVPPDDGACGLISQNAEHRAICGLVNVGVTVVAAAGNEESDFQDLGPATYSEVLTVTAMGDRDGMPGGLGGRFNCDRNEFDDFVSTFTNYATTASDFGHVVAAPGVCIPSTFINGGFGVGSGTSFSTPHVAGTVALCIYSGKCSGLTPRQIVAKIVSDAEAYNLLNPDYGYQGDPLRPIAGKYYGYLISAGGY